MAHTALRKMLTMLLFVLGLVFITPTFAIRSTPPSLLAGVSGSPDGVLMSELGSNASYRFDRISFATNLWADGKGDVILDVAFTNLRITDWRSLSWGFGWGADVYSHMRAWDAQGPLTMTTQHQATGIILTPQFREPVPIGASYQLSLAITINAMARGYSDHWRATWQTRSNSPVDTYVEQLILPTNAYLGVIEPTPSNREGNRLTWQTTNPESNWTFTMSVNYTLSDQIAAPLFLQRDQPWGSKAYGSYADTDTVNTVGKWGCYMTAAAIIARYHGDHQGVAPRIDPEDLNTWLRTNRRYDGNYFNAITLPDYASERGVMLANQPTLTGGRTPQNDAILDRYLRSGNPVILKVNARNSPSGIHFVVAVGRTRTSTGIATYNVLDPYYGEGTLATLYNNHYVSIIPFTGTTSDPRMLSISGHSPIALLVTDPLGRRAGYDPRTDQYYTEIPNALYTSEGIAPAIGDQALPLHEVKNLTIFGPLEGSYSVEVLGTGEGSFMLVTIGADWRGHTTTRSLQGDALPGSEQRIAITYEAVGGLFPYRILLPVIQR
jgi:hypothetical protein